MSGFLAVSLILLRTRRLVILSKKLKRIKLYPHLTYLYFNAYLLKSVFFGCSIIKLTSTQTIKLCKLYEKIIAKKLRLGETFPRHILYVRQNEVRIGLIKLETAIAISKVKLYIGNIRANTRIVDLIKVNEERVMIEYR